MGRKEAAHGECEQIQLLQELWEEMGQAEVAPWLCCDAPGVAGSTLSMHSCFPAASPCSQAG